MPRRRQRVPRDDAAPARSEVLSADLVNVAGIGGTPPQKAGVLLVEATVPLAVRVPAAFYKARLDVQAAACETQPVGSHPVTAATVTPALVVAIPHDGPVRHTMVAPRNPMAVHMARSCESKSISSLAATRSQTKACSYLCGVRAEPKTAACRRHVAHTTVAAAASVDLLIEVVNPLFLQIASALINELGRHRSQLRRTQRRQSAVRRAGDRRLSRPA